MTIKYYRFIFSSLIFCTLAITSGCKKNLEIDAPYTSFNGENIYTTDATAISAVTTMYARMGSAASGIGGSLFSITYYGGLSADEFTLFSGNADNVKAVYQNDLSIITAPDFWRAYYEQIYLTNAAIEGLSASSTLTPSIKKQLVGESKFMRAFCYFYLINLYGDVPLVTSANYKANALQKRTTASLVWQQVITDLKDAKDLLNPEYLAADLLTPTSATDRVRPNRSTAIALLARAYLFTGDYANAQASATEVISNTGLYGTGLTTSLSNIMLKDASINKEAVWQIQGVTSGWNTNDGRVFLLPATGPNTAQNPVYLSRRLVASFEANDARRSTLIKGIKVGTDSFYYPNKYKSATLSAPVTEYMTVFRTAELYLIRAEAKAQLNDITGSQADLNIVRTRAGLGNTTAATKDDLITAIMNERRHELFSEWGHRWFDIKRTNTVDAIMSVETSLKNGTWQSTDKLYPISLDELNSNPNLTQTPGY